MVARSEHGTVRQTRIDLNYIKSNEYAAMRNLGARLEEIFRGEVTVRRGDRQLRVSNFNDALMWLFEEARKGQNIQRYKGLGEMNPEQLWETTMDITTRRMLKVNIEDGIAADEVFTTLMGDQVEPRREFIERNALSVSNLDI